MKCKGLYGKPCENDALADDEFCADCSDIIWDEWADDRNTPDPDEESEVS